MNFARPKVLCGKTLVRADARPHKWGPGVELHKRFRTGALVLYI